MATDKTEVPVGTVIGITIVTITALVSVQFGIKGYFHSMYDEDMQRKSYGVESPLLRRANDEAAQRLSGLGAATQQVATSLTSGVRPPAITPQASSDLQALQGWGQRPRVVPAPPPARGDMPVGAQIPVPGAPAAAPAPAAAAPAAAAPTAAAAPAAHPTGGAPAGAAHPAP